MSCCVEWQVWKRELLTVSCLSIAAKWDEEYTEHSFEISTIQHMEMTILKALDWRLSCVTPYSYIISLDIDQSPFVPQSVVTDILFSTMLDIKFLEFRASSIAAAALRFISVCDTDHHGHIPIVCVDEVNKCEEMMKDEWFKGNTTSYTPSFTNLMRIPYSPDSVIPATTLSRDAITCKFTMQCICNDATTQPVTTNSSEIEKSKS